MKRPLFFFLGIMVLGLISLADMSSNAMASSNPPVHAESGHAVDGHVASGAEAGHGTHHGPAPINWVDFGYKKNGKAPPLVAALFNFILFITLLFFHIPGTKIGLGLADKLRTAYSDKHVAIKDGLAEGAKLRGEAEAKLREYGQKIKDVDSEVEGVLTEIKKDAEMERKRIVEEANHQAARAKAETEKRIQSDLNLAKKGLEKSVLSAAALKAAEKIKNGQNADDQARLFEQFMGQLDQEIANKKSGDELLRRI